MLPTRPERQTDLACLTLGDTPCTGDGEFMFGMLLFKKIRPFEYPALDR